MAKYSKADFNEAMMQVHLDIAADADLVPEKSGQEIDEWLNTQVEGLNDLLDRVPETMPLPAQVPTYLIVGMALGRLGVPTTKGDPDAEGE
jgi:hypothetical protein